MKNTLLPKCQFNSETTIASQLYDFLRQHITESCIVPGTPLTENELSQHFNISRQPVRQALIKLSQDGLVEIIPQRGSFVKKISVSNLKGICFIRSSIECNALYEAERLGKKNFKNLLDRMSNNLRRQHELVESFSAKNSRELKEQRARYLRLDDKFHSIICAFSGTSMAWELVQSVKANMDRIRFFSLGEFSAPDSLTGDHEKIFNFIKEQQFRDAAELLRTHLYEITSTYKPIRENNSEWFLEEDEK